MIMAYYFEGHAAESILVRCIEDLRAAKEIADFGGAIRAYVSAGLLIGLGLSELADYFYGSHPLLPEYPGHGAEELNKIFVEYDRIVVNEFVRDS